MRTSSSSSEEDFDPDSSFTAAAARSMNAFAKAEAAEAAGSQEAGRLYAVAAQELLTACLVQDSKAKLLAALKKPSVGLGTAVTFQLVDVLQEEDVSGAQKGTPLHQPFLLENGEVFVQVFQPSEPFYVFAWPLPPAGTRCTVQIVPQRQGADALIEIQIDKPYISTDNPRASFSVTASCGGTATLTYSFTCEPAANLEFATSSAPLDINFANIAVPAFMDPVAPPSPFTDGIPFFAGHATADYTAANPGTKPLVFSVDSAFMKQGATPVEVVITPAQGVEITPNPVVLTPDVTSVPISVHTTKPCSNWNLDEQDAKIYPHNDT